MFAIVCVCIFYRINFRDTRLGRSRKANDSLKKYFWLFLLSRLCFLFQTSYFEGRQGGRGPVWLYDCLSLASLVWRLPEFGGHSPIHVLFFARSNSNISPMPIHLMIRCPGTLFAAIRSINRYVYKTLARISTVVLELFRMWMWYQSAKIHTQTRWNVAANSLLNDAV